MAKGKQTVFQDVAEKIRERVVEGIYVSAQKLPSEYDLAEEFKVSRLTVRKAIEFLISQDVLVKQKGKGTYVMKQPKIQSGRGGLQGFTEAAKSYGLHSETRLLSVGKLEKVPDNVKEALALTSEEPVVHILRLRLMEHEPMTLENLFLKAEYITDDSKEALESSLFNQIEEKIEITYSHQEVEAILVTPELSKILETEVGQPLLMVHSIMYSASAKPIMYDRSYYRADRYTFKNTLHRLR